MKYVSLRTTANCFLSNQSLSPAGIHTGSYDKSVNCGIFRLLFEIDCNLLVELSLFGICSIEGRIYAVGIVEFSNTSVFVVL